MRPRNSNASLTRRWKRTGTCAIRVRQRYEPTGIGSNAKRNRAIVPRQVRQRLPSHRTAAAALHPLRSSLSPAQHQRPERWRRRYPHRRMPQDRRLGKHSDKPPGQRPDKRPAVPRSTSRKNTSSESPPARLPRWSSWLRQDSVCTPCFAAPSPCLFRISPSPKSPIRVRRRRQPFLRMASTYSAYYTTRGGKASGCETWRPEATRKSFHQLPRFTSASRSEERRVGKEG